MIDLTCYDKYHLGVSGGKDSTAALLWLRFESGLPLSKVELSFNETDNEDWLTYTYLAFLAEVTGLPIRYVDPEMGFWDLARKKKRFPSRKARFCTQHLKIIPSMRLVEKLKERGRVLLLSGVRRDEGRAHNDRGDLEQLYHDDTYGCDKFLPIYDWSLDDIWSIHRRYLDIEDVITIIEDDPDPNFDLPHPMHPEMSKREYLIAQMRAHGVARNPLYDMGARRVGCFPCINSAKLEIRAMDIYRPSRIDFIEEQEGTMGREDNDMFSSFFARNTVPKRHRSKTIVTADGEEMQVATIRDVARWSKTAYGGKQFNFDFAAFDDDQPLACDMRGMCE